MTLPLTEETIKDLHRLCRGEIWDAGQYKERESDIVERYPDGRQQRTIPGSSPGEPKRRLASVS